MIKIIIYSDSQSNTKGLEVSGHAGQGKKGEDIVCAGVSALTYTLLNSLEGILHIKTGAEISSGYVKFNLPEDLDNSIFEQSQLILNSIILGYRNMEESYKQFIDVRIEEV